MGMAPISFSEKLLELWGGSLVVKTESANSQVMAGTSVAEPKAKEAADASETRENENREPSAVELLMGFAEQEKIAPITEQGTSGESD